MKVLEPRRDCDWGMSTKVTRGGVKCLMWERRTSWQKVGGEKPLSER